MVVKRLNAGIFSYCASPEELSEAIDGHRKWVLSRRRNRLLVMISSLEVSLSQAAVRPGKSCLVFQ